MTECRYADQGHAVIEGVLGEDEVARIARCLAELPASKAGTRQLLSAPWCGELARRLRAHAAIAPLLPADAVPLQCTFFEKSRDRNWLVAVHQDLSVPVAARVAGPELRGWSEKEGIVCVQPPLALLAQLIAVRLHIDPCGEPDGPLKIVPGSHRLGFIAEQDAPGLRDRMGETVCTVASGGVLLLSPLALHASSKSTGTSRRRVLHFVFGPKEPGWGLSWREWV